MLIFRFFDMSDEAKIVEILKQNPAGLGTMQIVKLSGLKRAQVSRILEELVCKEVVVKKTKGCRVTYVVKE